MSGGDDLDDIDKEFIRRIKAIPPLDPPPGWEARALQRYEQEIIMTAPQTTSSGLALVAGQFEPPPFVVPNGKGEAFKIEQVVYRDPARRTEKLVWWFLPDDDRDPHNHPWCFLSDEEAVKRADATDFGMVDVPYPYPSVRAAFIARTTGADLLPMLNDGDRTSLRRPWTSLAGISFISIIEAGGYMSRTYSKNPGDGLGVVHVEERVVRAGDVVAYPFREYHTVKDVLPGTRTRMICGPATPGNQWGYLDPKTGREYPWQEQPDTTFVERMLTLNPWRRK